MYRKSAAKRTGIYRVSGNMADFQMEIKLRHISEWLPVPKFEYTGASSNSNANANANGEPFSDSPMSSTWGDFFIYVPHEDQHGNYYNYFNYYNPGSEYPSSAKASGSTNESGCRSAVSSATAAGTVSSLQTRSYEFGAQLEQLGDGFYAQNKELCNGGTANLCIAWQQKHFSRTELQRYGDATKCVTSLQRRYHRWTQDILELQQRHQREVDRHQALYEEELRLRRRRSKRKEKEREREREREREKAVTALSSLAISDYSLEAPPLPEDPNFAARTCLIHTLIDVDFEELDGLEPGLQQEVLELHSQGYQLMYVYAQLQRDTLLLTLRYSAAQGLLYVYPDFNFSADDMDYVLEIDNDCRQLYAYGFQNVTPLKAHQPKEPLYQQLKQPQPEEEQPTWPAADASAEQLLGFYQRQRLEAVERRRLLQFSVPPKRMRRVSLLLELRQAQHFEYANIHVRYYVNPPQNTLLEPSNPDDPFPLRGATATCVSGGGQSLASFCHCWQLTLLCEESYQPDQLLHIYFEVISIDSWQRERCEGYAHFSCALLAPLPAAVVNGIQLQCIRPVGSWLDALNRYFIGGRTLFDFVGYFNGSSRNSSLHSRLEWNTSCAMRSTGTLLFSMRKLQQRQLQLGHHLSMYDSDDDEYSPSKGPKTTLDEVLAAYVDARDRIEALLGHAAAL
ncbi:Meckel syndrome type 1 protein homolog [Drosophila innubila]|uniref:Meckel syndrome type 1 protein homolog n=1 Tax=Drosophila innubila TaxID=198719 RepID=UPI00148B5224|nr:Meckel syndrome type 1 protein homolog [Drosophila innubila]